MCFVFLKFHFNHKNKITAWTVLQNKAKIFFRNKGVEQEGAKFYLCLVDINNSASAYPIDLSAQWLLETSPNKSNDTSRIWNVLL